MKRRKKLFAFITVILCLFGFNSKKVNAAWGADAEGDAATYIGGGVAGCTDSGYALMRAALLQVCLVDVFNEPIQKNTCIYYKSSSGAYYNYFSGPNNEIGTNKFSDVLGDVTVSEIKECYTSGATCWWDKNYGEAGLTYLSSNVKSQFLEGNNKPTDFFVDLVKELLTKKGLSFSKSIAELDLKNLSNLSTADKEKLKKYRIIVEPVYGFGKQDPSNCNNVTKYIFATIKGIAEAAVVSGKDSASSFGESVSSLYNNNYTNNTHGLLNRLGTGNYYADLADPLNTRGYSIYYAIPENSSCMYDETKNKLLCSDGNECNFSKFIDDCTCSAVTDTIKSKFLSQLSTYNAKCSKPVLTNPKVEGNLYACTVDSPIVESYSIKYGDLDDINETNTSNEYEVLKLNSLGGGYCKLRCEETFNFNNVQGRYKDIKAGTYFQVTNYPTTLATKDCKVEVKANQWYKDYESALRDAIASFNNYQNYLATQVTKTTDQCCANGHYETKTNEEGKTERVHICDEYDYKYIYPYSHSNGVAWETVYSIQSGISLSGTYQDSTCGEKSIPVATFDASKLVKLLEAFDACNKFLFDNRKQNKEYYQYKEDLDVYVEQMVYDSNSKTNVVKKNTDYDLTVINETDNGNPTSEYETNKKTFEILNKSGVTTKSIYTKGEEQNDYELKRWVQITHTYRNEYKYTESYTGKIVTNTSGSLIPTIALGYGVYEIDLSAVHNPINDNTVKDNQYYYTFNKLGDSDMNSKSNGQLYEYFADGKTIKSSTGEIRDGNLNDLKRYCEVGVINEVPCFPGLGDTDCIRGNNPTSKILYKIVDPVNIDPNRRIEASTKGEDKGFQNWLSDEAKKVVEAIENTGKNDMTFSPDNLEYSFELDSKKITEIREYNDIHDYLDYTGYKCDKDGNYCISDFVTRYSTVTNGRKNWQTFDSSGILTQIDTGLVNYS